ncbi:MAG: NFACT RNA binding domain-containing protein [Candidatus Woesearchaeota archaeon]
MKIVIDINKSLEQNAQVYFEKAKKLKKKIPGIRKIIDSSSLKLSNIKIPEKKEKIIRKKEWFEKFRWFISSDGFLVVGGRDATTNEIIIKKYVEKDDIVFHTELAGSPFVIIKNPDKITIPERTIVESAEFCASYSKSWKSGRGNAEVYHIMPEQVSKEAPSGMAALAKGSFMIYGKRNYIDARLNIAICIYNDRIMSGPITAIKNHSTEYVEIIPGTDKLSDVAKKVQKRIGGELDEIIRALPAECTIKK